ncbi:MAG: DUF4402 domain-containing protein [Alphaproteobacteria bacterium]|nr:DUF4402 domain-containing protein [Alphaproteobacteria bacterium]
MRKYFLLSAVALLATTTANAGTDYAEVTAKATIEVAAQGSCSNLNFGTIVVKANNAESTVKITQLHADDTATVTTTGDILSVSDAVASICDFEGDELMGIQDWDDLEIPSTVTLNGPSGNITATLEQAYNPAGEEYLRLIGGTLTIPAKILAGDYIGAFTASIVW